MSYEVFKLSVNSLIEKAGGGIRVDFSNDETGRFIANCSDGTTIIGNSEAFKVTVKWRTHQAMAVI